MARTRRTSIQKRTLYGLAAPLAAVVLLLGGCGGGGSGVSEADSCLFEYGAVADAFGSGVTHETDDKDPTLDLQYHVPSTTCVYASNDQLTGAHIERLTVGSIEETADLRSSFFSDLTPNSEWGPDAGWYEVGDEVRARIGRGGRLYEISITSGPSMPDPSGQEKWYYTNDELRPFLDALIASLAS